MKRDDELQRLLGALEPPRPPESLRGRALAAAEGALREESSDLWARLWHRKGLRLGWLTAVAMLVAGHVVLSLIPQSAASAPAPLARTRVHLAGGLEEVLTVPPIRLNGMAFAAEISTPVAGDESDTPLDDPSPSETNS